MAELRRESIAFTSARSVPRRWLMFIPSSLIVVTYIHGITFACFRGTQPVFAKCRVNDKRSISNWIARRSSSSSLGISDHPPCMHKITYTHTQIRARAYLSYFIFSLSLLSNLSVLSVVSSQSSNITRYILTVPSSVRYAISVSAVCINACARARAHQHSAKLNAKTLLTYY